MSAAPSSPRAPATVSLGDEEAVRRIIADTLFGLWATINNLTRLRPSKRERYRVTVFGSARAQPGHWVCQEVKRMCSALSALGCDIVTGGGPGLMQAANEGAHDTPLVFAGSMSKGLVQWASAQMLRPGLELASPQDMQIPRRVDDAEQAVTVIREHHARWLTAQGQPA